MIELKNEEFQKVRISNKQVVLTNEQVEIDHLLKQIESRMDLEKDNNKNNFSQLAQYFKKDYKKAHHEH